MIRYFRDETAPGAFEYKDAVLPVLFEVCLSSGNHDMRDYICIRTGILVAQESHCIGT